MLKLFTHDTTDLHPALNRLLEIDPADHTVWHQRYILLLWLSLICMLPFDLAVLDSDTGIESDAAKILTVAKRYLVATDKVRGSASVLVSRLVTLLA